MRRQTDMTNKERLHRPGAQPDPSGDSSDRYRFFDGSFHDTDSSGEPWFGRFESTGRHPGLPVSRKMLLIVDEDAGDVEGDRHPVLGANQMQHHVQCRRGAARGEAIAVDNVAVCHGMHGRESRGELLDIRVFLNFGAGHRPTYHIGVQLAW